MIPGRELLDLRSEWQIDVGVIEKDYVLGWLLAGIGQEPALNRTWIFKGGTCLRKCYYETYRFSEDLDFTVVDGGPEDPSDLIDIFGRVAAWVREESGIELVLGDKAFQQRRNLRGKATVLGRIGYSGPKPPSTLPKVKLDVTSDEVPGGPAHAPFDRPSVQRHAASRSWRPVLLARRAVRGEVAGTGTAVPATRPVRRRPHASPPGPARRGSLRTRCSDRTCEHAGIAVPDLDSLLATQYRREIEQEWENMLGHQLPKPLPPFPNFWDTLPDVFAWLAGERAPVVLQRADRADLDPGWTALAPSRRGVAAFPWSSFAMPEPAVSK